MKITPENCVATDPWELAKKLGIEYVGDMNPIPHDGAFYSLSDLEYGYAPAVRIMSIEEETGMLWVESGCFVGLEDFNPEEDWIEDYPFEVDEDYSGRYQKLFRGDEEWHEFDDLAVWKTALPWIIGLAGIEEE